MTFTGKEFYPLSPRQQDIDILDIAHALSNICRWTGHAPEFYSVAQHSVLVSKLCDPEYAMWGLLHDAAEAYVSDISRPVKHDPKMKGYRAIEDNLIKSIALKFGLKGLKVPDHIKMWDARVLQSEATAFFGDVATAWKLAEPASVEIKPVHPRVAKSQFISRFNELNKVKETALVKARV